MNTEDIGEGRGWLVLLTRMPTEPARHRMALWRELRRSGALLLGPSAWAIPDIPVAKGVVQRVGQLVEPTGGTLLALSATGYGSADAARLDQLYSEARNEEWAEFLADCGKFLAELEKETAMGKFTLAELEEEEQGLDRLRRWYRELRGRDLLGAAATTTATIQLKVCQEQFEQYAEHVYTALNGPYDR
jgi:hypothetical protein